MEILENTVVVHLLNWWPNAKMLANHANDLLSSLYVCLFTVSRVPRIVHYVSEHHLSLEVSFVVPWW